MKNCKLKPNTNTLDKWINAPRFHLRCLVPYKSLQIEDGDIERYGQR